MTRFSLFAAGICAMLLVGQAATPASAAAQCGNGFTKVQTFAGGSIRCKAASRLPTRIQARRNVALWKTKASCNTNHWSAPQGSIVRHSAQSFEAIVTFICAVIT